MKITGQVFCLDVPNVNTDQIIPAIHLTCVSIKGLGQFLLEGLPGFNREDPLFKAATILVARENFGCGSSREHAVWALEDHGFKAVIAPSFARIFRQNMFNRGLPAIQLPPDKIDALFTNASSALTINLETMQLSFTVWGLSEQSYPFELSEFDKTLVLEGGLVGFAVSRYEGGKKK